MYLCGRGRIKVSLEEWCEFKIFIGISLLSALFDIFVVKFVRISKFPSISNISAEISQLMRPLLCSIMFWY